jgi:DNA-binding transcriptional ArsR family regulator
MATPLHQLKAEFFKALGHPVRIRVLELLTERERSVGEMLSELDIEASNLSQQLAVLRRAGLVLTRREASTVYYSLTSPQVAELLTVTRGILTELLADRMELLSDLQAEASDVGATAAAISPGNLRRRAPGEHEPISRPGGA